MLTRFQANQSPKPKLEVVTRRSTPPAAAANSNNNRSISGGGSQQQQQQQSGGTSSLASSSKFHLPELTTMNNNNNSTSNGNSNGREQLKQEDASNEAMSAYDRQQQQIEDAIAAAISGGSDSPERNGSFNGFGNDEFLRRLIEAVKHEPALYNPNHEHYGNKHSSAQYKAQIWQRLCKELDYHEDPHSLQQQWKRCRDRYVREKRRRKSAHGLDLDGPSARYMQQMRWIDEFLGDSHQSPIGNNVLNLPSTSTGEQYFEQPHLNGGIGHGGKVQTRAGQQRLPIQAGMKGGKKNNESTNGSPSSTSSEISVGSTHFEAAPQGVNGGGQQPSQIMLPQLRHVQAAHSSGGATFGEIGESPRSHQVMYKLKEELGPHSMAHGHHQQHLTDSTGTAYQIIAPEGNYYQQPAMLAHSGQSMAPPRRKRAALEAGAAQVQAVHGDGQMRGGRGTQLVLDHVNQPRQQQISTMVHHPVGQQMHGQQNSLPARNISGQSAHRLAPHQQSTSSTMGQQPPQQYILANNQPQQPTAAQQQQQQHYDPEAAYIEMIVRHLKNLNEDEKVVTKMNIQRILMDARFGRGACVRMFNDELAVEQQRHLQQQQQQNSVNNGARR